MANHRIRKQLFINKSLISTNISDVQFTNKQLFKRILYDIVKILCDIVTNCFKLLYKFLKNYSTWNKNL